MLHLPGDPQHSCDDYKLPLSSRAPIIGFSSAVLGLRASDPGRLPLLFQPVERTRLKSPWPFAERRHPRGESIQLGVCLLKSIDLQ